MKTLFFDTETSTLPNATLHPSDPRQAHLVQFAAILHDDDRNERAAVSIVINPDVDIAPSAASIHGIDNTCAKTYGAWATNVCIRLGIDPRPPSQRQPVPRGNEVELAPVLRVLPLKPPTKRVS